MFNDLIGLRHKTAARFYPGCEEIDCFFLVVEARKRLGKKDDESKFMWVFDQYNQTGRFPVRKILSTIHSIASPTESPEDGDLALISVSLKEVGIGVYVNGGILMIGIDKTSAWIPNCKEVKLFKIHK